MLLSYTVFSLILRKYNLLVQTWNLRFFRKIFRALALDLGLTVQDVEYVVRRSLSEGLTFFTKVLPKLGKEFDRSLADRRLEISSGIKLMSRRKIPHFMGALFLKVFTPDGLMRKDACPVAVRAIRQVCYTFYKVNLPHKWEDEKRVARGFVDNEAELRLSRPWQLYTQGASSCPTSWEQNVLALSALTVSRLFGKMYLPSTLRPKHSKGSVVHGYNTLQKYSLPRESKKPWSTLGSYLVPFEAQATDISKYPVWSHTDYFSSKFNENEASEVLFVPKDSRGPRLIAREPKDHQYLQQGFKDYAMQTIERHPITCGRVNFASQSINNEMSRIGSVTRDWATLDLKDASDRNSLPLVRLLWSACPVALAYLDASRTAFSRIHGRILELAKYAPMGSALCFPIMAMNIFALLTSSYALEKRIPLESAYNDVFVYGDDIIVKTGFANKAMQTLEHFGFKVNREKSFVDSYFTESCGSDWFKGNKVTPVRLRSQCLPTNSNIVSLLKTANLMKQENLHHCAELLYSFVERVLGKLPYSSSYGAYLGRWAPRKYVELYNSQTPLGQRTLRAWTIVPDTKRDFEDGYSRLERSLSNCTGYNPDWTRIVRGLDPFTASEMPQLGEYTPPRRFTLRKRVVHMA